MERAFDYHNFTYLCFLVKLSRELSPEQVKHYKNWLQARNISHLIKFTETQLSEIDKYSILNIFNILRENDLIDQFADPLIEDFLKENNLEHLYLLKQTKQRKKMDFPSPVTQGYPSNENSYYPHVGYANYSNYYIPNPEFTQSTPNMPHNPSPLEMNLQKNVFANENNYKAEVNANGGAVTITSTTYNGLVQVIKTGSSSPETKSPVDEPEEDSSPISPEFIDVIASEIGREWKTVARKGFKLEEGTIDEIEYDSRRLKDQVVRMITLWKSVNENCSQLAFAKALCKSNLRGIVKGNFPTAISRVALN